MSDESDPIAIGGLGGSGTRVVAAILRDAGVDIGPHLNQSLDNLFFSNLLKDPNWLAAADDDEIAARLALFGRCTGGLPPERRDVLDYWRAARRNPTPGTGKPGYGRLLSSRISGRTEGRWGWKEPNTHIYLAHLPGTFPGIRYVHVLRDPLDMAFSSNLQQLTNWGRRYGVVKPDAPEDVPKAQLRFSLEANFAAVDRARSMLGDRCHVLRFEALCDDPGGETERLLRFAGIEADPATTEKLAGQVQRPQTAGRHEQFDNSWVRDDDIRRIRELGYEVDQP